MAYQFITERLEERLRTPGDVKADTDPQYAKDYANVIAAGKTERRKAAREAARSVLPNCAETKMFLTGNARAWRSFFEFRASRFADKEIRRLANAVYETLLREGPDLFGDYQKADLGDGTYELTTANRKV